MWFLIIVLAIVVWISFMCSNEKLQTSVVSIQAGKIFVRTGNTRQTKVYLWVVLSALVILLWDKLSNMTRLLTFLIIIGEWWLGDAFAFEKIDYVSAPFSSELM